MARLQDAKVGVEGDAALLGQALRELVAGEGQGLECQAQAFGEDDVVGRAGGEVVGEDALGKGDDFADAVELGAHVAELAANVDEREVHVQEYPVVFVQNAALRCRVVGGASVCACTRVRSCDSKQDNEERTGSIYARP